MLIEHFRIADRFRGPPRSGNGGYVCGRIASHLRGTVASRLKAPPPLGRALRLESTDEQAQLFDGDTLIGEARPARLAIEPPSAPAYDQAMEATPSYLGFRTHRFPGCFVCGPEREPLDGLRIFPGAVAGTSTIAATWTPDTSLADEAGRIRTEFLWSALDCTGGFAVSPLPDGVAIVLGELCASIVQPIATGQPCVVSGWRIGQEGRKRLAGSAVHTADGDLVALARAVWIEVPASAWA